ncbi:hypothetical protein EUTSA_v10028309mg [Eutrema salsugineum]|uniref:peroxidase n=1 Tax=Eutrema salsugineum TaxID=72664 RepID=V4L9K3_EUTSA|nr:hypothetical protein EUTSA_v10028309mg [Eutrema salsugineum]
MSVDNLPSPSDSVAVQQRKFAAFAILSLSSVRGHTIGTAVPVCGFFTKRIFNTTGNTADPTMDQTFLPQLQRLCPQNEFMASRGNFNAQFAKSMVKMSNIGVKTGANGEIRRVCSAIE